jgi:hypothetical protein
MLLLCKIGSSKPVLGKPARVVLTAHAQVCVDDWFSVLISKHIEAVVKPKQQALYNEYLDKSVGSLKA